MRFLKLVSCVCLFSFVAVACNDEKGTDGPKPSSNGIVNGESQSSAFTLTFYSTFNGLNFSERTYGRFGAFFAEKGSFDQDAVDAWANGGTVQNREFMKETSQLLAGDRMKLFLEGLEPETEYELLDALKGFPGICEASEVIGREGVLKIVEVGDRIHQRRSPLSMSRKYL